MAGLGPEDTAGLQNSWSWRVRAPHGFSGLSTIHLKGGFTALQLCSEQRDTVVKVTYGLSFLFCRIGNGMGIR